MVDTHFAHPAADGSYVSWIAERQAIDPRHDLRFGPEIAQISQPGREFVGSPDRGHL
jgi:hypothetical protein